MLINWVIVRLKTLKVFLYISLFYFALVSCSSKRYLADGDYLLKNNRVDIKDSRQISKKQLGSHIFQQPNKSIFIGTKFHLGLYNMSPRSDSSWLGRVLKGAGEAPVVFDPTSVLRSMQNMERYLENQGYYNTLVDNEIFYKRFKVVVRYDVELGLPHRIRNVSYDICDEALSSIIAEDSLRTLLKWGRIFSLDLLENERDRVELLLRNRGFYSFRKNFIRYEADTLAGGYRVDLKMIIDPLTTNVAGETDTIEFRPYRIRDVYIYTDYDAERSAMDTNYIASFDTLLIQQDSPSGKVYMLYHGVNNVRPGTISYVNNIIPGDVYNERRVNRTYENLSEMRIFRAINIQFDDSPAALHDTLVDCVIRLTPSLRQGYKIAMDASSNSAGLFGLSPTITYMHKNLFKGAEWLSLGFSGNFLMNLNDRTQRSTELGALASISVPKFLFPYVGKYFRVFSPRTEFSTNYNYQQRPEYTRNSYSVLFGYNWRTTRELSYILNLFNVNVVRIYNMSSSFYQSLNDPYLRNRYDNHFVLGSSGSVIYTNRMDNRDRHSFYLRWNASMAGNILSLFNNRLNSDATTNNRLIWNIPYSQYAKTDINFSFYQVFDRNNTLAYRIFGGIGRGYGNSISLPFEEVYFAGGAYSLRGWQARTVGPGSAVMDTTFSIPNQVGELKLEANLEYRFGILSPFEGALFVDAGNVWSLTGDDEARFKSTSFYKQIAMNTGVGIRLNFKFVLVRFDLGLKLYEPRAHYGWVSPSKWFKSDNSAFHIGIGYSF